MDPSNIPMVLLGAGILWFGWFGFNAGSALTSGGLASSAFMTTYIAGAAGAVTWMILGWCLSASFSFRRSYRCCRRFGYHHPGCRFCAAYYRHTYRYCCLPYRFLLYGIPREKDAYR